MKYLIYGKLKVLLLSIFVLSSCHNSTIDYAKDKTSQGADSMAVVYYKMQVNGQFQDYINAMKSCDSMPSAYQQRIVSMLRHHQKQIFKEKQGVKDVKVLRTEMHNNNFMANVFLNISYNDNTTEEILFPMVYDGEKWRVQ